MLILIFASVLLLGYLLGSFPTGYLVAKAKGIDIRTVGSGNIGATNAFRILGKGPGSFVLLMDAVKGGLACAGLPALVSLLGFGRELSPTAMEWLRLLAGFSAILGHNYTCWLGFKGGKGIATSAGVLLALVPMALLIILGVFLVTFGLSRYVSLGSVLAAASLPFAAWATGASRPVLGVTTAMAILAIYKHRANIQRLLAGTENRIGSKKEAGR